MEVERVIGTLEAEVKAIREDVKDIKQDVKSLLSFKWKLLGASMFVAFVASMVVEIGRASLR